METIKYRFYFETDLDSIVDLLNENNLPVSDLSNLKTEFIVAVEEEKIIGCIGIEHYKTDGLLRSMAINLSYRKKGIGNQLLLRLLSYCRQLGIENVHLLTTTAEKYFLSKGFVIANRDEAPKSIKDTTEFTSICPSSSSYMILKQINKRVLLYKKESIISRKDEETESKYWAVEGNNLMFTYFEVPPNKTFKEHIHENEQVTYVLDGNLFFQVSNEIFCVEKGNCIVIPSNIPHKVWTEVDEAKAVDAWTPVYEKYK